MPAEPHIFTQVAAKPIIKWVNERRAIYMRKAIIIDQQQRGLSHPDLSQQGRYAWGKGGWTLARLTDDPIMQRYKFCNVFRELDRVTVWIREHIREPYADHEHLWFMLAMARFINWPPTLAMLIAGPDPWPSDERFTPERLTYALEQWKAAGNKVETGAYMIRAENDRAKPWGSWSKQRYVAEVVLGRAWKRQESWRRVIEGVGYQPSLEETWLNLNTVTSPDNGMVGWGPFMAGQIVADLRHTRYLRNAPDVGRWAPVSIGSARGLNRLAGRKVTAQVQQDVGLAEMLQLQALVNAKSASYVPPIELHDIQNALCETDKYLRVQTGEGRPRATYVPGQTY